MLSTSVAAHWPALGPGGAAVQAARTSERIATGWINLAKPYILELWRWTIGRVLMRRNDVDANTLAYRAHARALPASRDGSKPTVSSRSRDQAIRQVWASVRRSAKCCDRPTRSIAAAGTLPAWTAQARRSRSLVAHNKRPPLPATVPNRKPHIAT